MVFWAKRGDGRGGVGFEECREGEGVRWSLWWYFVGGGCGGARRSGVRGQRGGSVSRGVMGCVLLVPASLLGLLGGRLVRDERSEAGPRSVGRGGVGCVLNLAMWGDLDYGKGGDCGGVGGDR